MIVNSSNEPTNIFDTHFALKCPSCNIPSNISAISIPRYEFLTRFKPDTVGIAYRCDSCNAPIFLKFNVIRYDVGNARVELSDEYTEIERPKETFDLTHLPESVAEDFREALTCYSNSCFNAFAAMCRRCVQSIASNLGSEGKDKVLKQVQDLKEMAEIDDETFDVLRQVVIDGHDGAHPHLPKLSAERANVLLELMKDVLYQTYIRKAKLQEAKLLRVAAIPKRE